MSDPTDRFMIEIGTGTTAHIIDMDVPKPDDNRDAFLDPAPPGEKLCTRGHRHYRYQRVPFPEFATYHDIEQTNFEGDAPDQLCSYCWSRASKTIEKQRERAGDEVERTGPTGYRLRWKQKGRARDEWYDIVVRPETTLAELDRLVCRFTTLDDFHLRMYGLENEYLDSSLNVLPDHQYERAGDPSYTRASEMTIAEVAERAGLWDGDRLTMIYDFGTPSYYYCIVKEVYEPAAIDAVLEDSDVITATDTAAIIAEKRP